MAPECQLTHQLAQISIFDQTGGMGLSQWLNASCNGPNRAITSSWIGHLSSLLAKLKTRQLHFNSNCCENRDGGKKWSCQSFIRDIASKRHLDHHHQNRLEPATFSNKSAVFFFRAIKNENHKILYGPKQRALVHPPSCLLGRPTAQSILSRTHRSRELLSKSLARFLETFYWIIEDNQR